MEVARKAARSVLRSYSPRRAVWGLWAVFVLVVVLNAWVTEDAFITFRVLENFFRGYGLRWNVHERVQVFTHPLWMLLHIPFRVFIPNLFIVSCLISVLCTAGAVWVMLRMVRKPVMVTIAFLFVPLVTSKAFLDYSTSGLENSLFYLLYAAFGALVLKYDTHPRFWFLISLVSSLMLFNRLDTVIFIAPTLCWLATTRFSQIAWRQVFLGALPLLSWFGFALLYYGFIFPNTKYAKLHTGLDPMQYLREGWHYFHFMLVMDIPSGILLFSAPALVWALLRRQAPHRLAAFPFTMAMGLVLYVLYIINIGGDYMMGRFWSFPVFAAIWLLYVFSPPALPWKWLLAFTAALALTSTPVMKPVRQYCKACAMPKGRMDDGKWVFGGNKLVPNWWPMKINTEARHKFVNWGKKMAAIAPPHAEKGHYIGMLGYYAGPSNIIIDEVALGDALLARLPLTSKRPFYIGHFYRTVPVGYLEAVRTGRTDKMDPALAVYYEKLRLITSGDLLSWERLKTIAAFQMGAYDRWKYDYLNCNVWS